MISLNLTPYANDTAGSCNTNGATGDVEAVFEFTLSATRNVTLSLAGNGGLDGVLYVRQGTCATGAQLACADAQLANGTEIVRLDGLAAGTYFVFVEAYNSAVGTATLSISAQEPPDAGPFTLVSTTPLDGGFFDGGALTAVFSRPLDTGTATATTAGLTWRGAPIGITNTLSADRLTLTGTTSEFPLNSTMTWNLTSGLTSNSEAFSGASIALVTRDGVWRGDALRQSGGGPRVAAGASRRFFTTWTTGNTVRAGHIIGTTWIDDTQLSTAFVSSQPEVAANTTGGAVIVFTQNQTYDRLYASRFVNSVWQTPVRIDTGMYTASSPQVTMDDAGNILVVWGQAVVSGGALQLHYARYSATNGTWSSPQTLGTGRAPVLAGNGNGDAIVAFEVPNSTHTNTTLSIVTFTRAGGFSTPSTMNAPQAAYFQDVSVAIAPDGTVAALFASNATSMSTGFEIRYARGTASAAFPTTSTVLDTGYAYRPTIALGRYGQQYLAWQKYSATSGLHEVLASIDLGGGAGFTPITRYSLTLNDAFNPVFAASDEHAVLVWPQGTSLRAVRFNGLTGARSLGVDGVGAFVGGIIKGNLALDARGRAALVYTGSAGVRMNQLE